MKKTDDGPAATKGWIPLEWRPHLLAGLAVVTAFGVASLVGSRLAVLSALGLLGTVLLFLDMENVKRLLMAIVIIEVAVPLDQYIGYDGSVAAVSANSGYLFGLGTVATIALGTLLIAERLAGWRSPRCPVRLITMSAYATVGLVALSIGWAIDAELAAVELVLVLHAVAAYACVTAFSKTRDDIVFVIIAMTLGLAAQSALTIAAVPTGGSLTLGPIVVQPFHGRAGGSFASANVLSSYLVMGIGVALNLIVHPKRPVKLLGLVGAGLGGITLMLTQSRGGFIATGIVIAVFVTAGVRRGWLARRTFLRVMVAGVVGVLATGGALLGRLGDLTDEAATGRLPLNELAFRVIGDRPLLGVGANNFATSMRQYLTVDFSNAWLSTVHNKYLLTWAELGLVGLVVLLAFLVGVGACARRLIGSRDTMASSVGASLLGVTLGMSFHMLVEIFHARVQYQAMWLIAGLAQAALAVDLDGRRRREAGPDEVERVLP